MPSSASHPDPADPRDHPAVDAVNEAVRLANEGRLDEAVDKLTAVVARYQDAPEPIARLGVASAMFNKGLALHALGLDGEALEALDATIERFAGDADPLVRMEAAGALRNKVALLTEAGRTDSAIDASRELVARFGHDAEPAFQEVVRDELNDFAIALAGMGRTEDALAAFGRIVDVYAGGDDLDSIHDTAMARYHRAVVLRDAGRPDESVAEFEIALTVVGDDVDVTLEPMLARLHYNLAVVLHGLDRYDEAIEHYSVVGRRFGDSDDPDIRGWVARSIYNHGSALASVGRFEEAMTTWDQITRRWGAGVDETTRERAEAVREQRRWLEDMMRRPHHIWSNPFEQSLTSLYATYVETGIDPESGAPVSPEVAQSYVRDHQEGLERKDALAGECHEAAVSVLWNYLDRGRPFALFLRNFDLEAYVARGSQRLLALGGQRPTSVEEKVMESWPALLPIVGIANPMHRIEKFFFSGEIMPRLEISNDRWLERVRDLVEHASVIVLAAREISPGLSAELSAITRAGREESTVIVIMGDEDAFDADLARFYGARRRRPRPVRPDDRTLARFPLVLAEDEMPWELIATASDSSEVLDAVAAATPPPRPKTGFWSRWS